MKPENIISYDIRGAIFEVYNELGPGLMESVYQAALEMELRERGHIVKGQVNMPVNYKGEALELGYRLDLLVDDLVIVEIKSVEKLLPVHYKQLLTYLKISGLKLGILVNFNTDNIKSGIIRLVNKL